MNRARGHLTFVIMKAKYKEGIKGTLSVVFGLAIILIPYSLLIGWNILTAGLFWFVIIPALAIYVPGRVSRNSDHVAESLSGLAIFYAGMIVMIYTHYNSDFFLIMIISCLVNLVLVGVILWMQKSEMRASVDVRKH